MPVAVVTGAAGGIGSACVELLCSEGWAVHCWDTRDCRLTEARVTAHLVDVSDPASVSAAAEHISEVHLLVNAAGVSDRCLAAELSPERWLRVINTNLNGTFYCCRSLYESLARAGEATVINIASITAHHTAARRASYCASKSGVLALTRVLATEWASSGIRVIAISPGYVKTPMVENNLRKGNLNLDAILRRTPQGRLAEPAEVAQLVLALSKPPFKYMTGSTLLFDGGWAANSDY